MNKHIAYFLALIFCSGCSVISKQYYYVPNSAHQTIEKRGENPKTIRSQVGISDTSGENIGSITTSNGVGIPLFIGPPYLPFAPIGIVSVFSKKLRQFEIDVTINTNDGYFMALAVDSSSYKKLNDSLHTKNVSTAANLNTSGCYMLINGSTKTPLRVTEYFMGQTNSHTYRMYAPVGFGKVRTMTIVTGNPLLDKQLKNMIFIRKKRLSYFSFGLS